MREAMSSHQWPSEAVVVLEKKVGLGLTAASSEIQWRYGEIQGRYKEGLTAGSSEIQGR